MKRAKDFLNLHLSELVRVRVRPANASGFRDEGVYGRGDAVGRYLTMDCNLFVDESQDICWTRIGDTDEHIRLAALRPEVKGLLLSLVRSEAGRIPAPVIPYSDLVGLRHIVQDLSELQLKRRFAARDQQPDLDEQIREKWDELFHFVISEEATNKQRHLLVKLASDLRRSLKENGKILLPMQRGAVLEYVALNPEMSVCHFQSI